MKHLIGLIAAAAYAKSLSLPVLPVDPPISKRKDPSHRNKRERKRAKKIKHAHRNEEELL